MMGRTYRREPPNIHRSRQADHVGRVRKRRRLGPNQCIDRHPGGMPGDHRDVAIVGNEWAFLCPARSVVAIFTLPGDTLLAAPREVLTPCGVGWRLESRAQPHHKAADAAGIYFRPHHGARALRATDATKLNPCGSPLASTRRLHVPRSSRADAVLPDNS